MDVSEHILDVLNNPVPKTAGQISRDLVGRGLFKSKPNKLAGHIKRRYLKGLVERNLVVEFTPEDGESWEHARGLVKIFSRIKPRRVDALYQTNFLVAFTSFTSDFGFNKLPPVDPSLNLVAMAFLHKIRGKKPEFTKSIGLNLFNFLMIAKIKEYRDKIRLFMYKLPLDYADIDLLEKMLDYGFRLPEFPFDPNLENAENFLREVSEILNQTENTGSKGVSSATAHENTS